MTNELTAGNGKPPEPRPIITQVIEFVDGSRIRVIVEAWTGDDDALAKKAYFDSLVKPLEDIES
jgi:hypothetical protein